MTTEEMIERVENEKTIMASNFAQALRKIPNLQINLTLKNDYMWMGWDMGEPESAHSEDRMLVDIACENYKRGG